MRIFGTKASKKSDVWHTSLYRALLLLLAFKNYQNTWSQNSMPDFPMMDTGKSTNKSLPLSIPPFNPINTTLASPNQFWKVSVCASLTKSSDPMDRNPRQKKVLFFKIVYTICCIRSGLLSINPHIPRCYRWIFEGYEQGKKLNGMSNSFGHRRKMRMQPIKSDLPR